MVLPRTSLLVILMLQVRRMVSIAAFAAVSLGLLAASGCGPTRATVSGKLVLPSNVTLADKDSVNLVFYPEDSANGSPFASVDPKDLTFTVKSPDGGNSIPLGKYKITVVMTPYNSGDADRAAQLKEVCTPYSTKDATKLEFTVDNGSKQNITVDMAAGKVTKN